MRSILTKILTLVLTFNIVLWLFVLVSDDFVPNAIKTKKDQISLSALLYAQIALPVIQDESITDFEKMVIISQRFSRKIIPYSERIKIYRFEADGELDKWFRYFDGSEVNRRAPILVTGLPNELNLSQNKDLSLADQIMRIMFKAYKPMIDGQVLTEPLVAKRARFTSQIEVLSADQGSYSLRVLSPIRDGRETVGIVEVRDTYQIKSAYFGRNAVRLNLLAGISVISCLLGLALATSIAFPLRKLSRRLDQKLSPDDLATQLQGFRINSLSRRRDEIGRLHGNFVKLTQQVTDLFREKEQFASEVSHELKNPIASIIAYAEATEGHSNIDAAVIAKMKAQAARMNKLVTEISEAAVVDNDLVTKKRERFDLSETFEEILDHYEDVNQYPNLKFVRNIQRRVNITGLQDRWGQVIVNLLDNAVSFTRPVGTIRVTLTKSWRNGVVLEVDDTGPGVSEAAALLIFERFYTARMGHSQQANASGLGLSLVKQIVEAHRGEIRVTSSKLGGAQFVIKI